MSNKVEQYYVPKFYLRYFSNLPNKKQLGVFNLKRKIYIASAPLRKQGFKPYLYGKDGVLEDLLSNVESGLALFIRLINVTKILPIFNTISHRFLLFFVFLMRLRNPEISDGFKKSFNNAQTILNRKREKLGLDPEKEEFDNNFLVAVGLSHINTGLLHCSDLKYKLLFNTTDRLFITSDNPVIGYNQFLEGRKFKEGMTGFSAIGLQIILPLTPRLILLFYDSDIYKIGYKKQPCLSIFDTRDVDQLNLLQFLNCNENVFFNGNRINEGYILTLYYKAKKFKKANQVITREFQEITTTNPEGIPSSLIITNRTECRSGLKLHRIKQLDKARFLKLDKSKRVHLRKSYYELKKYVS